MILSQTFVFIRFVIPGSDTIDTLRKEIASLRSGRLNILCNTYGQVKSIVSCNDPFKTFFSSWCVISGSDIIDTLRKEIASLRSGGRFKNTYGLLNLRALKFSPVNKIHIFQCMGVIFCAEFQRYPLKFHTKYLTHTLKDMTFIQHWNFKSS